MLLLSRSPSPSSQETLIPAGRRILSVEVVGAARPERSEGRVAPGSGGDPPRERELVLNNKLFVGSLAWETTDESLREAFEAHGDVTEAKVIRDRETGRSRGFGFVTFESSEDAASAVEAMNDSELDGRTIRVEFATERPRR